MQGSFLSPSYLSLCLLPSFVLLWSAISVMIFPAYNAGYAIIVVAVVFTIYVLALLLVTASRDPGIIPRSSRPPEVEFQYESSFLEVGGRRIPMMQFPRTKEVLVNGMAVRIKYCDTCMLYRPPRCSHCSICNNCVERFDHHCPFVGQCIGLTTYDRYSTDRDSRRRVYDQGCFDNFFEVLFKGTMQSRNDFRASVQEEIQMPQVVDAQETEAYDSGTRPRQTVEHDLEIGGDLLAISQGRNFEEADENVELPNRGSNDVEGVDQQETMYSSRGRSESLDVRLGFG